MKKDEFIQLYNNHVTAIYRYVFLRVNSRELAQDLTSEVFLRAWANIVENKTEAKEEAVFIQNPKSFLFKIARNLVIDFYRKKDKTDVSLDEIQTQIPDFSSNPEEKTNLALEMATVRKALNQLKDDYRDIIIWHYLEELSIPEIAEILEKTENATRVMLSRGLEKLRSCLESQTESSIVE